MGTMLNHIFVKLVMLIFCLTIKWGVDIQYEDFIKEQQQQQQQNVPKILDSYLKYLIQIVEFFLFFFSLIYNLRFVEIVYYVRERLSLICWLLKKVRSVVRPFLFMEAEWFFGQNENGPSQCFKLLCDL